MEYHLTDMGSCVSNDKSTCQPINEVVIPQLNTRKAIPNQPIHRRDNKDYMEHHYYLTFHFHLYPEQHQMIY